MPNFHRSSLWAVALIAALSTAGAAVAEGCGRACKAASKTIQGTTIYVNGGTSRNVQNETRYRNAVQVNEVTNVRDVTRTRYVDKITMRVTTKYVQWIKRVTYVTEVRPITRIRTVTSEKTTQASVRPGKHATAHKPYK